MSRGSSKHPLFQRLDQRELIFAHQRPSSLVLESKKQADVDAFIGLFEDDLESQALRFHDKSQPALPAVFSDLLANRTVPGTLELLCAFLDRLFDFDFVLTISALLPFQEQLVGASATILRAHENDFKQFPFLTRTVVLLFGAIISEQGSKLSEAVADLFLSRAIPFLHRGDVAVAGLVLEGLKRFLRVEQYRDKFIDASGVSLLVALLPPAAKLPHSDTLYHILFAVWELSYAPEGIGRLSGNEFVSVLGRLVATIPPEREEIVRLLTQIIAQLNPSTVFVENAYDNDLLRLFRMFQGKKYVDPDLGKDIAAAAEGLHQQLKHLSLWDKYVREIKSGTLRWSLSHKSEFFWKANIERFGEYQYQALTILTQLLASADQETVCVACHDLGEFATRSPIGKVKLEEIGAKEAVMRLLSSSSQVIQREALRTTQLLLLRAQAPA
jgi:V-type H+-transporting ATPase subunit H